MPSLFSIGHLKKTETSMAPPVGCEPTWTTRRPSAIAAREDGVRLLLDRRKALRGHRPGHAISMIGAGGI